MMVALVCSRLEEQEKLVTAEGLYRRALSLDETNPEAKEALRKITETIQVSGPHWMESYTVLVTCAALASGRAHQFGMKFIFVRDLLNNLLFVSCYKTTRQECR